MSLDMALIGLGYVGSPLPFPRLAQQACKSGLTVSGFDVNAKMVDQLNTGTSHIDDLSDDDIATMITQGFSASTDSATGNCGESPGRDRPEVPTARIRRCPK